MESPVAAAPKEIHATDRRDSAALHGWKEIALELDRSLRTVQRWEKTLGLPVRRLGNDPRAAVFVFREELRLWLLKVAAQDRERELKQAGETVGSRPQSSLNKHTLTHNRILLVDDEPGIRPTLSVMLQRHGFTVTVAANVSEALEQIKNQVFEVLFCDLNIEREGAAYEVIRAVREVNPRCLTIVRSSGEPAVDGTDYHIQADLKPLLKSGRDHSAKLRTA